MQRCRSGRTSTIGNRVMLTASMGSNPILCATTRKHKFKQLVFFSKTQRVAHHLAFSYPLQTHFVWLCGDPIYCARLFLNLSTIKLWREPYLIIGVFSCLCNLNPRVQPLSGWPQQVAPFATLKFAHLGKFFNAAHPFSAPTISTSLSNLCFLLEKLLVV